MVSICLGPLGRFVLKRLQALPSSPSESQCSSISPSSPPPPLKFSYTIFQSFFPFRVTNAAAPRPLHRHVGTTLTMATAAMMTVCVYSAVPITKLFMHTVCDTAVREGCVTNFPQCILCMYHGGKLGRIGEALASPCQCHGTAMAGGVRSPRRGDAGRRTRISVSEESAS